MKQLSGKFIQFVTSVAIIIAFSLPGIVKAEYVYTYTSNPFNVTSSVITQVGDFDWITVENTFETILTAEIRTTSLLTTGVGIDDVISLTFTGMPYEGYTRELAYPGEPVDPNSAYQPERGGFLNISSLDANGLPTAWNMQVSEYVFLGGRGHYIEMSSSTFLDKISGYDEPFAAFYGELQNNPGTWQVAFVTPVPEVETYAMFLAGLGMIGWVARRRQST